MKIIVALTMTIWDDFRSCDAISNGDRFFEKFLQNIERGRRWMRGSKV
jgi:hypothetical protein